MMNHPLFIIQRWTLILTTSRFYVLYFLLASVHCCHAFFTTSFHPTVNLPPLVSSFSPSSTLHTVASYHHRPTIQTRDTLTRHYANNIDPNRNDPSSSNSFCSDSDNMTRRQAFKVTAAATLMTFSTITPTASGMTSTHEQTTQSSQSILCKNVKTSSSLNDILVGKGEWIPVTSIRNNKRGVVSSNVMETSIVPPNFATYATRFLIHYDGGFRRWWNEVECSYSLLSYGERRNNLGKNFGSLARTIQIALERYILQTDDKVKNSNDKGNVSKDRSLNGAIRQKFEDLLAEMMECYGSMGEDVRQQLGIMFATLPKEYQPVDGLQQLMSNQWNYKSIQKETWMENFTQDFTQLLPFHYKSSYDTQLDCYVIQPTVSLYEIGVNDEFGQNAVATAFGPLSHFPLQRQNPNLPPNIYALLGINGALACALTHSLVIPFDVVKTRMQTDPEGYTNIVEGTMSIAKAEGMQGFTLGAEATIAGYFWYGLSVYPTYSFLKWYLGHSLLSPAYATAHADAIALVAGAIAAVIASVGLTPLEACRIRTVAEPEVYRDIGLAGTLRVMAQENETVGWRALYDGLPSLMIRQVIFGSVKFLAFERACEAFFTTWPWLKDTMVTALGVTLISGALSGALSSVVSQPADSVLTYVAKNKRGDGEALGIVSIISQMIETEGVGSLFRGLGSRCIWASAIISGQFLLYDIFRTALGINSDDLSQVFEFVISKQS